MENEWKWKGFMRLVLNLFFSLFQQNGGACNTCDAAFNRTLLSLSLFFFWVITWYQSSSCFLITLSLDGRMWAVAWIANSLLTLFPLPSMDWYAIFYIFHDPEHEASTMHLICHTPKPNTKSFFFPIIYISYRWSTISCIITNSIRLTFLNYIVIIWSV